MLPCNLRETNEISLVTSIASFSESLERGEDVRELREEISHKLVLFKEFHGKPPYDLATYLVAAGFFYQP
jgi:hypothetical protein